MPDDDVIAGDAERVIEKSDAVARRGLSGDGDFRARQAQPIEANVAAHVENNGRAPRRAPWRWRSKRARARGVQIRDVIDIAAAPALRIGAIAFGAGKRGDGLADRARRKAGDEDKEKKGGGET